MEKLPALILDLTAADGELVFLQLKHTEAGEMLQAFGAGQIEAVELEHLGILRLGALDFIVPVRVHAKRQQEILLKAAILALFALLFTFVLARRLASSLSQPIRDIGNAVKAIHSQTTALTSPRVLPPSSSPGKLPRSTSS